ncbi:MAG: DoxX family protein [Terriglobia bacterium]
MLARLNALRPVGLLLVRVVLGAALMSHGVPKLFDNAQFLERFPQMGFPAWTVYVAGGVEFFGGLLLILGLFSRLAAFLISGEFFVAFLKVHWKFADRGVFGFLSSGRDEYPLLICVVAFLLFTVGAGAISLDRLLFKDKA